MINRIAAAVLTLLFSTVPGLSFALSEEDQLRRYVMGNTLTTLYHEFGHALVTELELPVVGREEDAVDTFSVLALTEILFDEDTSDDDAEEIDYYLWATIDGWLGIAEAAEDEEFDAYDFADAHSLDMQRFHSHLCLVYGSAPDYHDDLIEAYEIDAELVEDCDVTFEEAEFAWNKLLENNDGLLDEGTEPSNSIRIKFKRAKGKHARYQNWVQDWPWLEDFESYIEASFNLPKPIIVNFEHCGEANAWWNPNRRSISICYEIMEEFAELWPGPAE